MGGRVESSSKTHWDAQLGGTGYGSGVSAYLPRHTYTHYTWNTHAHATTPVIPPRHIQLLPREPPLYHGLQQLHPRRAQK